MKPTFTAEFKSSRRVFIDCGFRRGLATKFFRETHPEAEKFEYFAFEGNPNLYCPSYVVKKAIWTRDGEIDFYLGGTKKGEDMQGGSTLIKDKKTGGLIKRPLKVECINFSNWLSTSFSEKDYIIIKMNIEGSEYKIIKHMSKNLSLSMVNIFYISWHWKKIAKMTESKHKQIEAMVPHHFEWALNYEAGGNIIHDRYARYFLNSLLASRFHENNDDFSNSGD